jgi:copper/silver efflux system protein
MGTEEKQGEPSENDVAATTPASGAGGGSPLSKLIGFCLHNKLVVALAVAGFVLWGVIVAPFDWDLGGLPRNPVPVDAIPDIGENQQIVFTKWMGRSPQDVEDQITYPLTVALLGVPGVKTIRSYSMLGFSSIYVIFKEDVEFYWSRSRLLEKLNSLPSGTLPGGVQPALGPDATALGQVYWYTLEGRDPDGEPTGGWDLHELRSAQDWYVRYALLSADGVAEVASVGGFVQEYQVDVDPDAMRAYGVTLEQVFRSIRMSNVDVGARTIEVNRVEYVIRGLGFIKNVADVENTVIVAREGVPVYVRNVAHVSLGPALRRGALDKGGAEAVGGVVVVRYGDNPLQAIKNVKAKIAEIAPGLPKKILSDGTVSQVTIVPFYDRTGLIHETLGTLSTALTDEILVTIIVILFMLMHFRSSLLVSALLPLAVLLTFIAMKQFKVDANVVALSGIAIAVGTIVDMGIVVTENILKHLERAGPDERPIDVIQRATAEVGGAVVTAVSTTVVSFLPVFTMEAAEGKLFKPLAYTKTFALVASIIVALTVLPPLAHVLLGGGRKRLAGRLREIFLGAVVILGLVLAVSWIWWLGVLVASLAAWQFVAPKIPEPVRRWVPVAANVLAALVVIVVLANHWMPLGPEKGLLRNVVFAVIAIGGILGFFTVFQRLYPMILRWALAHKALFLSLPLVIVVLGLTVWLGAGRVFGWLPQPVKTWGPVSSFMHTFPGLGKEFMPPLDEGSYLYMPTTMPHASIGEVLDVLKKQDMGMSAIPEVADVVGKLGRAETPLDPAPVSMIETVINYHSKFVVDEQGRRLTFRYDPDETDLVRSFDGVPLPSPDGEPYVAEGTYERDDAGALIEDEDGHPFRLWRPALDPDLNDDREAWPGVASPDDIWDAIVEAADIPGTTGAPKLQPIAARIVMLQSGMRAPMGVKVKGPDLETIERVSLQIEGYLKEVPSVMAEAVIADRIVGKPYLEIDIDREAIARYGIHVRGVQDVIEVAVGGKAITSTVEGRERYPVRVRYMRELRDDIESLGRILVAAPSGAQIPLEQLTEMRYVRGPQAIKSEDTFLIGYVLFDKRAGTAEVDVVERARDYLEAKVASGDFEIPAGVSYTFAGSYENQVRSEEKLMVILPVALFAIFLLLYFQFKRVSTTALVFSGIVVAWSGGFILIWLYSQGWFMDVTLFGENLRELFQVQPINLSVAIWVGFLALFGIASDDGVIIATYLDQTFERAKPTTREAIRAATVEAGKRRVRPALMTVATTVLALIPVLTSTGRGSDIMVPMAIPTFGGMLIAVITVFVVPVLYAMTREIGLPRLAKKGPPPKPAPGPEPVPAA